MFSIIIILVTVIKKVEKSGDLKKIISDTIIGFHIYKRRDFYPSNNDLFIEA